MCVSAVRGTQWAGIGQERLADTQVRKAMTGFLVLSVLERHYLPSMFKVSPDSNGMCGPSWLSVSPDYSILGAMCLAYTLLESC